MRDINRIDEILADLGEQWKRVPDWRLGQLFNNLQRYAGNDLFYFEDDKLISKIREFLDSAVGGEEEIDGIDLLIKVLDTIPDKNGKALLLQQYISIYGPIPDERGDEVKSALSRGE